MLEVAQQLPHDTGRGVPLEPSHPPVAQRSRVAIEKHRTERSPLARPTPGLVGRQEQATQATDGIPRAGSERRLVEVVQVEVVEPVVTVEGPEVLQVQIAAGPGERGAVENAPPAPILPEEMTGTAKEGEDALRHRSILESEPRRVAALVEPQDPVRDRTPRPCFRHEPGSTRRLS